MASDGGDSFEVWIADDDSSDNTAEVANELCHVFPQVRFSSGKQSPALDTDASVKLIVVDQLAPKPNDGKGRERLRLDPPNGKRKRGPLQIKMNGPSEDKEGAAVTTSKKVSPTAHDGQMQWFSTDQLEQIQATTKASSDVTASRNASVTATNNQEASDPPRRHSFTTHLQRLQFE